MQKSMPRHIAKFWDRFWGRATPQKTGRKRFGPGTAKPYNLRPGSSCLKDGEWEARYPGSNAAKLRTLKMDQAA